jgi:hypothetical protein
MNVAGGNRELAVANIERPASHYRRHTALQDIGRRT